MNKIIYNEDVSDEFGVEYEWKNAMIVDSIKTARGTLVEIVERPQWGLACYMNNSIQSCTVDERFYHEALVHPVMLSVKSPKRVCIIGGGEGATAREVLRFPSVEKVDMFEWDADVVHLFQQKYSQWAQGAWSDPRLSLHYEDIFEAIQTAPKEKYDVVIIDLFEPCEENRTQWTTLLQSLHKWITPTSAIVLYAGMRNILVRKQPYQYLTDILTETECWRSIEIPSIELNKQIIPYRVWIPSFSGESTFLLLKPFNSSTEFSTNVQSHLTEKVWESYKTLNW